MGLMTCLAVMALVSQAMDRFGRWPDELSKALGFWSLLWGTLIGVATFGLAFAYLRRRAQLHPVRSEGSLRLSRALLLIAAPLTGLMGLAFLWWNMTLGSAPLTSLEGAWLWPAGIVPLFVSYLMFGRAGRIRRFLDAPRN
jgi:hypothetical protein